MTAPMRPAITEASEVREDNYTFREAVEWFKRAYKAGKEEVEVLAEQEAEYMNKQFGKVVERTERDQKLPHGPLGQFISSVAIREVLLETAEEAMK